MAQDRNPLRAWEAGAPPCWATPLTQSRQCRTGCLHGDRGRRLRGKCLAAGQEVAAAFRSYEDMRMRRTAFVGRQSRRIGAIGQWENRWVVAGRNLAARIVLSLSPDMRLNPVYAYEV